jgi:hypothetical protein
MSAAKSVPYPAGLSTRSWPSRAASRSASPTRPLPSGRAPPAPSSRTCIWRVRPRRAPAPSQLSHARAWRGWSATRRQRVGGRLDVATRRPSLPSSPLIRRWPQRGFSRASRITMSLISADLGGGPRRGGRLPPFPAHECAMPPQQRSWGDQTRFARRAWQVAGRAESRARSAARSCGRATLAAQNIELVAQDQQLDVLDVQATTSPNQCAEQRPEREVEEGQGHGRRSSSCPCAQTGATRILAPFRPANAGL